MPNEKPNVIQYIPPIQCPLSQITAIGCSSPSDLSTYVGACSCGALDTGIPFDASERIAELLVDGQVKANVSNSLVRVWPQVPILHEDPSLVIDACLSFENMCDQFFNRVGCPASQRKLVACNRGYGLPQVRKSLLDTTSTAEYFMIAVGGPMHLWYDGYQVSLAVFQFAHYSCCVIVQRSPFGRTDYRLHALCKSDLHTRSL